MYYIFNTNGNCVASCQYVPDADDLKSRNETAIKCDILHDIMTIQLVDDKIVDRIFTDSEGLKDCKNKKLLILNQLIQKTNNDAIAFGAGEITEESYAPVKSARMAWRIAINTIESCTTVDSVNAVSYSTDIPKIS